MPDTPTKKRSTKRAASQVVLTAARAREVLSYNPESGTLTWVAPKRTGLTGAAAGSKHVEGYLTVRVDGRAYLSHRLAWLMTHGRWPAVQIDHANGDRADNRLANLRECSNAENCQNVRSHRDSTSRHVGVSLNRHSKNRPWQAQICVSGRQRNLGYFATEGEAVEARRLAKAALHPFNPLQETAA